MPDNGVPPGLHPHRLLRLMGEAVERLHLDLRGMRVLTEAATGAYVVTPVLAALAGAREVMALTRSTRYGSADTVAAGTAELAALAGVGSAVQVYTERDPALIARADIVTNSGHVRPIDAEMVGWMQPGTVIPLMYEAWEMRAGDLDLAACQAKGIRVGGTNERHPAVNVFGFLGLMAVKLLTDAGIAAYGARVLLLCDNPFRPYLEAGLKDAGASVTTDERFPVAGLTGAVDAILVALRPTPAPVLTAAHADRIREAWPGAAVLQFWGDLDRPSLAAAEVPVWPLQPPAPGHMGILPSQVGPEPIVRLQAGGLKVGEVLRHLDATPPPDELSYVELM